MKNIAKVWRSSTAFLLSAFSFLILITSCSNELDDTLQPVNNGNLQFVVSDFPAFGESGLTRAIGTQDEGKTAWADGDKILVHLYSQKYGDQAATLTFDAGSNTWESDDASLSYLENETPTITAVYAPDCEIKSDKTIGLLEGKKYGEAEYIPAKTTISGNTLDISFERGRIYSRLRIVSESEQALTITTTGFTPAGPENVSAPESYTLVADGKDNAYLYGSFAEGGSVTVKKGDAELATHTFSVTSEQGKSYALYAGKKVDVDLSTLAATYVINDDAYYTFTGTGSYGIKVESGNPRIILNNVNITVGEEYDYENVVNALDIVADNNETTVWITGTNNLTSNSGAGIYVKSGSTVIIKSDSRDNILTAQAGCDGAGIGGFGWELEGDVTSGNIYIENVTVNAYSSGYMTSNPGIGAYTSCGTITIKNATVTALGSNQGGVLYGGEFCPAIGASTVPDIVIENSTINAYRGDSYDGGTGSLADWIGAVIIYDPYSGDTPHTPGIQCGNGYIISTTVNKFLYKAGSGVTKEEGSVTYDADGNPTEQAVE